MTEEQGLLDAILLRHADRLVVVERQAASNTAEIAALHEGLSQLRFAITDLTRDFSELRSTSIAATHSLQQMQPPLQGLLELRQRFSGGWLVATAMVMVAAYLFQPLLSELLHLRFMTR